MLFMTGTCFLYQKERSWTVTRTSILLYQSWTFGQSRIVQVDRPCSGFVMENENLLSVVSIHIDMNPCLMERMFKGQYLYVKWKTDRMMTYVNYK